MWELLTEVFRDGGIPALFFCSTYAGLLMALRALWRTTRELQSKIDQLQDKRILDAQELVRELVEHVNSSTRSAEKVAETMDNLRDLLMR